MCGLRTPCNDAVFFRSVHYPGVRPPALEFPTGVEPQINPGFCRVCCRVEVGVEVVGELGAVGEGTLELTDSV